MDLKRPIFLTENSLKNPLYQWKKNGESFIYANNGQVTKELLYKDGLLHGAATYYDPKGLKIREGFYTEGEKSGHWKYFSDGKLDTEEDY